jgi:hypothetical protein
MKASYNYNVVVTRSIIETGEINSKGNPKTMAVTYRKMFLTALAPLPGLHTKYRAVQTKRNGEIKYSISYISAPKKDKWEANILKLNNQPVEEVWKREESLTEAQFKVWLAQRLGDKAGLAFITLLATEPERAAA